MLRSNFIAAIRSLLHHRGFTVINILGLTIGLTASAMIILYVIDELSYDRFHENADKIFRVAIKGEISGQQLDVAVTSAPFGPALLHDFPDVKAFTRLDHSRQKVLFSNGEHEFYIEDVMFADSGFTKVFTLPLIYGDPKTALQVSHSIVLSQSMAKQFFGNENPVGKVLTYNNQDHLIVTGLFKDYPLNSHMKFKCLISFATLSYMPGHESLDSWGALRIYTYLLLDPASSRKELNSKLTKFLAKYMGDDLGDANIHFEPYLQALREIHLRSNLMAELQPNGNITDVYTLITIILFILILASINFMNLSTARSANRAREVGIRKVAGCAREKLIIQFLGESVLISLFSLFLAMILLEISLPVLNHITGKHLEIDYIRNWQVTLGFLLLTIIVGIFAGSYPAFYLSSFNPLNIFQGKIRTGASNRLLRNLLVLFQFTISIILMTDTLIIYQQLKYIRNKELGFTKENLIIIPLNNNDVQQKGSLLKGEFLKIPGIRGCALTSGYPGGEISGTGYLPEGISEKEPWLIFSFDVDPDFAEKTMNMSITMGRNFSEEFITDSNAVLINETLLHKLGWEDPAGRIIRGSGPGNPLYQVVGVVKDFHNQSLHEKINPVMIKCLPVSHPARFLLAKLQDKNSSELFASMKQVWDGINPEVPFNYQFLDVTLARFYDFEQKLGKILLYFTFFAFIIAALGLSGLTAFSSEQRTKEIGIRKVFGSSSKSIRILLLWDFAKPILPAVLISIPAAFWLIKRFYLQNFAYQSPVSIWIFILAGLTAVVIAIITVTLQTTRAAASNPVDTLRYE